jgi:hypothetical protein
VKTLGSTLAKRPHLLAYRDRPRPPATNHRIDQRQLRKSSRLCTRLKQT